MPYSFAVSLDLSGTSAALFIFALFAVVFLLVLIVLSPSIIVTALARKRAEQYKTTRNTSVIAQYDPPHGFSPAELGFMYDMRCSDEEVWATLIDLRQRGVITISSNNTVIVSDTSALASLPVYERIAIQLHVHNDPSQIATNAVPEMFGVSFPVAVQQSLAAKGFPTRNYTLTMLLRTFLIAAVIGFWPLSWAAFPGTYNNHSYHAWSGPAFGSAFGVAFITGLFLWPLYLAISYLALRVWTRVAGRSWLNTKQVRAVWPEIEGYRQFLKQTDYSGYSGAAVDSASKSLPYAIALGLETNWQRPPSTL